MMLLDDTSTPFQPGKLRYRIESPSSNVVSVLLQKQNGIFELLVYQAGLTGSPAPLPDQQVSEAKITVSFGSDIETAKIFKPNSGQNVVSTLDHPSQITNLGIGADLVLIEIKPGVSGGSSGGNNGDGSNSSGSGSGSTSNRGSSSKKSGGAAQSSTDQTTTGQGLPVASDNPPVTLPTPLEKFLPGLQVQGIRSKLYVAGVLAIFLGLAFMWTFRRLLRRKLRNWLATHGKNN